MKMILISALMIAASHLSAEWLEITKSPFDHTVHDIAIVDSNNIIAVGDFGSVYKILLDGKKYQLEYIQGDNSLPSLKGILYTGESFIAVGNDGIILLSDSEGRDWEELNYSGSNEGWKFIERAGNEIVLGTDNSLFSLNITEGQIYEIGQTSSKILDLVSVEGKIFGCGENGLLFEYKSDTGINEISRGFTENITSIFSDGSRIYISPDRNHIHSLDLELNDLTKLEIGNGYLEVLDADIDEYGLIYISAVYQISVSHFVIDLNSKIEYANHSYLPTILNFSIDKGIKLFTGIDGVIGWVLQDTFDQQSFQGFRSVIHQNTNTTYLDNMNIADNNLFATGFNTVTYGQDWEPNVISNKTLNYIIGSMNGKIYGIRRNHANKSFYLSYLDGDSIIDIDSSTAGGQKFDFIEDEKYVYVHSSRLLYIVDKADISTRNIPDSDIILTDIVTDGMGGLYAADGFGKIHHSSDFINWTLRYEDSQFPVRAVANDRDKIMYLSESGQYGSMEYNVLNSDTEKVVFNFPTGFPLKKFHSQDGFVSITSTNNAFFAYSTVQGASWSHDTVPTAIGLERVLLYNNHMVAYNNKEIFVKRLPLASIEEGEFEVTQLVYPNPAEKGNTVNISALLSDGKKSDSRVILYDSMGKEVWQTIVGGTEIRLPTNIATGNYTLLLLDSEKKIQTSNLIIK